MNDRVLISFSGHHDLKAGNKGAIEQLITYLKPNKVCIFLTKDYVEPFVQNGLKEFYDSLFDGDIEIIETDIENPTDFEEIASKISDKIDEINHYVLENKGQAYLNLTSGTPAIISVLSLLAITGQLNRAVGMYAPNPTKDTGIKCNTLDFYKNSVAYKTVKSLINSMDYVGLSEFLKVKNSFKKLQEDKEFVQAVEFCKNRVLCNFEKAEELYKKSTLLQSIEYKAPKDLYEKSIECYMSAMVANRNNDTFQTTLKLAIVRENLLSYILYTSEKAIIKDLIDLKPRDDKKESYAPYINEDVLSTKYVELKNYIESCLSAENKQLDCSRELTSYLEGLLFKYFVDNGQAPTEIQAELKKLDSLRGARNEIAHNVKPPKSNPQWCKSIEQVIILIAQYHQKEIPLFDRYIELNKILLNRLKDI